MYKSFDITGKVALVVGGHGGIGKAIALALAKETCDVACLDTFLILNIHDFTKIFF